MGGDQERDAIYANPDATEDDYMHAAELEGKVGEYDSYTGRSARRRAVARRGHPHRAAQRPDERGRLGWKLRVLLTQALFANPDILLLDEPTNNLDINTIRWLEDVLNNRDCTMVIISHDRHFLNQVCTHMADLDHGTITIYPGNYDDYMEASTMGARAPVVGQRPRQDKIRELQAFVRRSRPTSPRPSRPPAASSSSTSSSPRTSSRLRASIRGSASDYDDKDKLHRLACEVEHLLRLSGHGRR